MHVSVIHREWVTDYSEKGTSIWWTPGLSISLMTCTYYYITLAPFTEEAFEFFILIQLYHFSHWRYKDTLFLLSKYPLPKWKVGYECMNYNREINVKGYMLRNTFTVFWFTHAKASSKDNKDTFMRFYWIPDFSLG